MNIPSTTQPTATRGSFASGALGSPSVQVYRSLADLAPLAAQLDALNLASRRPSPFDTFAYLETFVANDEFEEPGRELLLLVAFDGDRPVGFLPLRRQPERLLGVPFHSIQFLVSHDNDRPRAVARPEDEARCCEAFYRHILDVERGWSHVNLQEQDAESKLVDLPASVELARYHVRRFPNNPNATLLLPYRSLAEYLRTFEKSHRRHIERTLRRLASIGALELVTASDPGSLAAMLDLYLDVDRRSWKAKVSGHIGRHPRRLALFRRLCGADQPMRISVHLLLLGGLPIAGMVAGAFGGRLYALEMAFDERYRDLSPGNAMTLLFIWDAIEKGYPSINLLGNYAYYKSLWHATITDTFAVQIYRKGSLVHLKALAGAAWRKVRRPVTQRDVTFNLARGAPGEAGDVEEPSAPPDPSEEIERVEAAERALEAAGPAIKRLSGDALEEAMPFAIRRGNAAFHGDGARARS